MTLELLILGDYGSIPAKIGAFLLKNNSSTLIQIQFSTGLSDEDLALGLSILIQRRFVKFFIFEKTYKYTIIKAMIKRRLYFPIYLNYISNACSAKHAKYCLRVLTNGIVKETDDNPLVDELIELGILRLEHTSARKFEIEPEKHFKLAHKFLSVNFDVLDQKVFEEETIKYVTKKYNEAAGSVLRALLKCEVINRDNIIDNLDSTKIQISDKGSLVNYKENITEYLKYLCSSGVVTRGYDEKRAYLFSTSKTTLKTYKMAVLIKDQNARRIFNMIASKPEVEDKDITIRSLLSVNKVKTALLALQRLGLITQKCLGDYSSGTRIEHSWYVDSNTASLAMAKRIEAQMYMKLEKINRCFDLTSYMDEPESNINVWTSDLLSLATDHLILMLGLENS